MTDGPAPSRKLLVRVFSRRLAVFSISCLVSVLLLEVGVLALKGPQVRFPRHVVGAPFGLRINEPNATYRHRSRDVSVEFRINSRGFRSDRDYEYAKPQETLRVISLGDSYTVGFEVDVEETFSAVLERELRRDGTEAEVINAGVSGYGTAEECLYLERELLKYDPDIILLSFFGNDFVDNTRSALFELNGDVLIEKNRSYVPWGSLADFLNTNSVFNMLSANSNAVALVKEAATGVLKRRIFEENVANLDRAIEQNRESSYSSRLTAAILERLYNVAHSKGIPLIVQSIPTRTRDPFALVEQFPLSEFSIDREGFRFLSAKELLDPLLSSELLYYENSQNHWTALSHRVSGMGLAPLIRAEHTDSLTPAS